MQGGKLPSGSGLVVWICKHLIELRYKPCPCYLFCLTQVEDGVDPLGGPGACSSSLHVQQDEQDIAVLIRELGVPHRSEEHTSELQSPDHLVCRLLLEKKKITTASQPP